MSQAGYIFPLKFQLLIKMPGKCPISAIIAGTVNAANLVL